MPRAGFFAYLISGRPFMGRLNALRPGRTLALTAGTISMLCALADFLFPDGMAGFVNAWFHGRGRERVLAHREGLEEEDNLRAFKRHRK
jgi:hypothetical protein